MKKVHRRTRKLNGLDREYDFRCGIRGKYAARYARGTNVVILSPDVAKRFPDSESANRALRACIELADKLPKPTRSSRK